MNSISSILCLAKEDFLKDFKPKYVMPWLIQEKVITPEERLVVIAKDSPQEQVEKLFEILATKGSREFDNFIKILSMEDEDGVNYPWLASKLMETYERKKTCSISINLKKLLNDGGIPFQINHLLPRENVISEIRDKLKQASNKRHWVVLHGMTGTGKSVFAAEAVRDNDLIEKCFRDGVFWLSLGILKDSNALAIKMKQLYEDISDVIKDSSNNKCISTVENLNVLNKRLKRIVTDKSMLVILDDLWDTNRLDVVKYFDIGCPILVTTMFPALFDEYSDFTLMHECKNDLRIDESKKLLSLYAKCEVSELPPVVNDICKKCKGSPFTLSHIGKRIEPFCNNTEHWNHIYSLLKEGFSSSICQSNSSSEQRDIKEVITRTLVPLKKYEDAFLDFVIFPEDVWVPSQVFQVLWGITIVEVECTIYRLLGNSLVQREKDSVNSYSYGIHDLYLEILKEMCSDQSKRHEKLVRNYLKMCKKDDGSYDFSLLPDDDYIYYYIAHHMTKVESNNILDVTLDDIYFDLKFMEKKLRLEPTDLVWDYQLYKSYFKNKEWLKIYRSFAEKHMYDFNNLDCDIIQLGLFEPENSEIYQKSLSWALNSKDKSYFKWCNQGEYQSHLQNLNLKLIPFQNTRHAAISSDGLLIACVGDENKAYIFSGSYGEDLLILSGHTDAINYCVFNSACNKLITASDDKSVRIFEINIPDMKPEKKRISVDFASAGFKTSEVIIQQHHAKVLCCCFSHDEELVVSSDENGNAYVWQSSTTHIKWIVHHTSNNDIPEPANMCSFNSDSTFFATAAYDSVILWHTESGNPYKKFSHDEKPVTGFCWTEDLVISVANKEIFKHNVTTEQCEKITCSKNLLITCCCISPDRNYLACGTSENTVIVYNVHSEKLIDNFKGHRNCILSVMYTEDGNTLLSVSTDGFILYDMAHVRNTSLISVEGNLSVCQNSNDLVIASSNYFDCLEVRKGVMAELVTETDSELSEITACSLSNDGLEVVYGTKNGSVKILDIQSNVIDDSLPKHSSQINYITHFGNLFFTCSEDKTLKIWNDRTSPKVLKGHTQSVLMCVPFKRSEKLLSCSKDGTLKVWNINSGDIIFPIQGHGSEDVTYCDISFDEKLLASASVDHTVKLWDAYNGDLYRTLQCNSEVRRCRFSPSFQVLISGCDSGEVRLWNLHKEPKYELLCPHSSFVSDIYFNHDGSQFLTISDEIKIWKTGHSQPQTLLLPSSFTGPTRPSIWPNKYFDLFVVILNSVMYVLKKIPINKGGTATPIASD